MKLNYIERILHHLARFLSLKETYTPCTPTIYIPSDTSITRDDSSTNRPAEFGGKRFTGQSKRNRGYKIFFKSRREVLDAESAENSVSIGALWAFLSGAHLFPR
ncbi:hypothetical protein KM043_004419 [Ampulex compressa]|nr:hypothetical protein KM043_004419 [Ampulex compressa]